MPGHDLVVSQGGAVVTDRRDDHTDAETMLADLVARQEIAVAIVPDYIRRARTARATRVGSGPDRPRVHGA